MLASACIASFLHGCTTSNEVPQLQEIRLDKTEISLKEGETQMLTAEIIPADAEAVLSWSSSDIEIATVDNEGLVTAVSEGEATITVSDGGDISAECTVTVTPAGEEPTPDPEPVPVESVTLNETDIELTRGGTFTLEASVLPENADYENIEWSSSDTGIATVNQDGTVTAVAVGEATIKAEAGGKSAECHVTVTGIPAESVTLDIHEISLNAGETCVLTATVMPEDADDKSVTWSSSNENVATVTDGTVTAMAAGTAEITASCHGLSDVCTVTVIEELKEPEVGDFYYSDGTWSASLNTSKTVIGIIFWTGNPAGDDTILGSDYPDCTHGLVVSIEQLEGKWQNGASKYGQLIDTWVQSNLSGYESMLAGYGYLDGEMLNFMLGYQYTKAIKAFNDAPENAEWPVDIVAGIAAFNESCPAPEGTSGWYLPSAKEASLIISGVYDGNIYEISYSTPILDNVNLLNGIIAQISGAPTISGYLWTSSEVEQYSATSAYCIGASDAAFWSNHKNFSYNYRYILAF